MNRMIIAVASAALLLAGAAHAQPDGRHGAHRHSTHGSERSREVHRMLARGENPGHHYGQTKSHGRDDHRSALRDRRDRRHSGSSDRRGRHQDGAHQQRHHRRD